MHGRGRHTGAAALLNKHEKNKASHALGAQMAEADLAHLEQQATVLRESLGKFAAKYRCQINADPEFRRYFTVACQAAGVDPLASNKAALGKLLGMGDFYFALGVQVVDVAMAARATQGVLLPMQLCLQRLAALRGPHASAISVHDVRAALKALEPLGRGVSSAQVNGKEYIVTLAQELSGDTAATLDAAAQRLSQVAAEQGAPASPEGPSFGLSSAAHLTAVELSHSMQWSVSRATDALHALLRDGLAWLDAPTGATAEQHVFFFPGLAASSITGGATDAPPASRVDASVPALPPSPPGDEAADAAASPPSLGTPSAGTPSSPPSLPAGGGWASGGGAAAAAPPSQGAQQANSVPSEPDASPAARPGPAPGRSGVGGLARLMALSGSVDIAALKLGARGRRR